MVTPMQLLDLSLERLNLESILRLKGRGALVSSVLNSYFDEGKVSFSLSDVGPLISSIESKLRKAEMIHHTYFGNFDHSSIISNSLIGLKIIETEYFYDTKIIREKIEIESIEMYKEVINSNFQSFILLIASVYENLVRLIEILVKKIIVYGKKSPHISTPLKLLVEYWESLIVLEYRDKDTFYNCLTSYKPFLDKYLSQINNLRNSFIHGYSINLEPNNNKYVVMSLNQKDFPDFRMQPLQGTQTKVQILNNDLVIEIFTGYILMETSNMTKDLFQCIIKKAKHPRQKIPM